jgi:hypothetical protein
MNVSVRALGTDGALAGIKPDKLSVPASALNH